MQGIAGAPDAVHAVEARDLALAADLGRVDGRAARAAARRDRVEDLDVESSGEEQPRSEHAACSLAQAARQVAEVGQVG